MGDNHGCLAKFGPSLCDYFLVAHISLAYFVAMFFLVSLTTRVLMVAGDLRRTMREQRNRDNSASPFSRS